ncbi:MAG: PfkB family carbohydrate kinase [Infirmifilum sp.]
MDVFLLGHLVVDIIVRKGNVRRNLGGTVTYGAMAALRHRARPHIISKIGIDFPDEYFLFLSRSGVDTTYITVSKDLPTTKFKLIYEDSDRTLYLLSRCEDILSSDVPLEKLKGNIAIIGTLIGEVSPGVVQEVSEKAALVASDLQGYIRRVTPDRRVILSSSREASLVASLSDIVHAEISEGKTLLGDLPPEIIAKKLVELGAGVALVTLGEIGAYIATSNKTFFVPPAESSRVVDRTGAGDVFTTVFAIEYQRSGDIKEAASYASAATSYLVEKPGIDGLKNRWELAGRAEKVLMNIKEL